MPSAPEPTPVAIAPAQRRASPTPARAAPASVPAPAPARPASTPRPAAPRAPAARAVTAATNAPGALGAVRDELGDCKRCRLHEGRKNIVFGVGNPSAELVLVGEAPGQQEDVTGEPFVGRSGQLLTRMLAALGLERSDVYICNVIKCRPPQNRDPMPDEIGQCSPFLHKQITAIQPRVILTLGRFAGTNLLARPPGTNIGDMRRESGSFRDIPVVATYHPSYLLRTPIAKRAAWDDLLRVRELLGR
ncbi:MAG: uracil-DNA glycosylase [Deltaproteobacteria bacterium]|nr:uracil-DNA glycosylase [Deltaproteobacteria bacterium]